VGNPVRRVMVTGASGFIGQSLCAELKRRCINIIPIIRSKKQASDAAMVGNNDAATKWLSSLQDVDSVIHLAARVHVIRDSSSDPLAEFRSVNTEGTLNLARQAGEVGVRRFIFLSTIGVNGNSTLQGKVFAPTDTPSPYDPYSSSKYQAEIGLHSIAQSTGMEVVIIRPPLVYGANAPGNFGKLTRLVAKGLPFPLGSINNLRSFVGIDNLVDFIITCLEHPAAANETFLVSDGEDLSTPDLIRRMARAMNHPARLLPVPVWALQAGASLLGKGDAVQRLCGNLQVDISKARELLGWNPPFSADEGLKRAVGGD